MAGSPVFSFVVDGVASYCACKPYLLGDEYWSLGAKKIGYYDSEERAEFYLKHESSMPTAYDCAIQFEEMMDKHLVEVRRGKYDLLVMKYKGICGLHGDLCIVGRTTLNKLRGYSGLLEDLPAFISNVLQSLLWSMLDIRGMFEVWEVMKATSEQASIDDFNTLHRQMDQLELMVEMDHRCNADNREGILLRPRAGPPPPLLPYPIGPHLKGCRLAVVDDPIATEVRVFDNRIVESLHELEGMQSVACKVMEDMMSTIGRLNDARSLMRRAHQLQLIEEGEGRVIAEEWGKGKEERKGPGEDCAGSRESEGRKKRGAQQLARVENEWAEEKREEREGQVEAECTARRAEERREEGGGRGGARPPRGLAWSHWRHTMRRYILPESYSGRSSYFVRNCAEAMETLMSFRTAPLAETGRRETRPLGDDSGEETSGRAAPDIESVLREEVLRLLELVKVKEAMTMGLQASLMAKERDRDLAASEAMRIRLESDLQTL
ncbi:hypothetical protein CKAN_01396800 [Cinnamomum micranthum f. kanehirae]|uniref:Uncharacterized protein n=1 Tax=Cinnamomum micranthum f. kanehirae TaxID=337451 RepID=A0A443P2S5_9MAGN|nr:hypothetical protein CKAN_01396800 [Cinnamomum micranthum f. kanehirae]